MFHVQQKKLTALHLKPKRLRRDIRTTVDSNFTRKRWLDIEYITEEMEGLGCAAGGKIWNLMLYARARLRVCGVG